MREPEVDRAEPPVWLSHPLGPETAAYGGGEGLEVTRLTAIERGDTADTLRLSLPNHLGTHVDVPAHFFQGARRLLSYGPTDWIYRRPVIMDVEIESGDLVEPEDLPGALPEDTDLLLLRTGTRSIGETTPTGKEDPACLPTSASGSGRNTPA